ncbi:helix-turn-helix domain-containing protein [Ruegeria arenilitoris]|uniref:helix-turn-helix domain-containing protein n=1 Tax=Ruegeria arenilitoris TaxID=1173585 RepID=UPI00147FAFBE|nr:helix-turn-helix transcriptional regulator [Ruegeria arenilitoris]
MAGPDDKKFRLGTHDGQFGTAPDFISEQEKWPDNPEYPSKEIAADAAEMLGLMIQAVRLQHSMSVEDLAELAELSTTRIEQIENGDLSVRIGDAFAVAARMDVPLYERTEYDPRFVNARAHKQRQVNALLQQRAFQARHRVVDDDF